MKIIIIIIIIINNIDNNDNNNNNNMDYEHLLKNSKRSGVLAFNELS